MLVARAIAGTAVVVVGRRITAAIDGVGAFGTKSLPHTESSPSACAANTTGKYAADDTHNSQANRARIAPLQANIVRSAQTGLVC